MSSIRTKSRLAAGLTLTAAAFALGSVLGTGAASAAAPAADLEVFAGTNQNAVGPGANFDLFLSTLNSGDAAAEGVRITADLPAGASLVSEGMMPWNCEASTATKIDCVYVGGALEAGGFAEANLRVALAHNYAKSRLIIPARVSTTSPESNTQNNTVNADIRVSKRVVADLYAGASATPGRVAPGDTFELTFSGGNRGNTMAEGIRFTGALPAGLELVNTPSGAYNCSASTTTKLDCEFGGGLAPGAVVDTTATVRVTDGYTKRTASVPVKVSTTNRETNRANNTAVATVRVAQS